MIEKQRLAGWLHQLGNRSAGLSDIDHLTQMKSRTTDSTWLLYLDAFCDLLERNRSFGAAIAEPMVLDLADDIRQRLTACTVSAEVDVILRDTAFRMLQSVTDYERLKAMLDAAGYRYSQHRNPERGCGPYDIDLYTAQTRSYPERDLTGETINVSLSFTDDGQFYGARSYSMGHAPANPLERGGPIPDYSGVKRQGKPRRAAPVWLLGLTAHARQRYMRVTRDLVEFMQGWASCTNEIDLDTERNLEIAGRARPFRNVQLMEIGDGVHESLPIGRLNAQDFVCLAKLLRHRDVVWCLNELTVQFGEDVFPWNCSITIPFPQSEEELGAAVATYKRLRAAAY